MRAEDDDEEYERGESKDDTAGTRNARTVNKMSPFGSRFGLRCSTTVQSKTAALMRLTT